MEWGHFQHWDRSQLGSTRQEVFHVEHFVCRFGSLFHVEQVAQICGIADFSWLRYSQNVVLTINPIKTSWAV